MEWLTILVLLTVPIGLASLFIDVWRAVHDKKRSVATAVTITCIVIGVPTVFAATYFETHGPSAFLWPLQTLGGILMFIAGISGAIGLVCDRRIAALQSPQESNDSNRDNLHGDGVGEPKTTADHQRD